MTEELFGSDRQGLDLKFLISSYLIISVDANIYSGYIVIIQLLVQSLKMRIKELRIL